MGQCCPIDTLGPCSAQQILNNLAEASCMCHRDNSETVWCLMCQSVQRHALSATLDIVIGMKGIRSSIFVFLLTVGTMEAEWQGAHVDHIPLPADSFPSHGYASGTT